MNINADDPKWTAYVLGELDATERAALELELEASEEAREFVEELRMAASIMKDGLASEAAFELTAGQRAQVRASAQGVARTRWFSPQLVWASGLAAACVLIAVTFIWTVKNPRPTQQTAQSVGDAAESYGERKDSTSSAGPSSAETRSKTALQSEATSELDVRPAGSPQPVTSARTAEVLKTNGKLQDLKKESSASVEQAPAAPKRDLPVNGNQVLDLVRVLPSVAGTPPPPPPASSQPIDSQSEVRALPRGQQGQQGQQDDALSRVQQGQQGQQGGALSQRQEGQQGQQGAAGGRGGGGRGGAAASGVASAALAPPPLPPAAPRVVMPATSFADAPVAPPVGSYDRITDNPFIAVSQQQLSTFSADVDTASYANVRRFLNQSQLPPRDAVRIEELVNYFSYDYPQASGPHPITGSMDVAAAPWNPQHRLVRIGIKAKDVRISQKASNLVLLIDVSGSMSTAERLPLLKSGMRMLIDRLSENDKISIVTYAAGSGVALQPTSGDRKDVILQAIENLHAEGGTNGGAGIQTAYEMAVANFIRSGVNRVILATDGDFNVGITDPNQLTRLIEDRARSGVYLTVLGFGNNFKDSLLGRLADKGHGNYSYIDSLNEARKVLVEQIDSTLVTVAKDVKIQVEFNPAQVNAYRLLGYENRLMQAADFNNDLKDAGDMGSGHTVTALYEVVPRGVDVDVADGIAAPLRYQQPTVASRADVAASREMLNLRIRYKQPEGSDSKLLEVPLIDRGAAFTNANADFRFAAAVAGFGMILRDSPYKGSATLDWVLATATSNRGADKNGYRAEFIRLVQQAMRLRR